jgi:GTP-binding protein
MSGPLQLEFVQSASEVGQLPDSVAEVAVIGRSNVGKSSLLNALANRKQLARVSKTPGRTQLINVFELAPAGSGEWLVDLPGYGYANAPKQEQQKWARMIESYLETRETLLCVLLLIDGEVGPTKLDLQTVDWLQSIQLPHRFVATKSDKVRPAKSKARRTDVVNKLGVARSEIRWVSASKGDGLSELRGDIIAILRDENEVSTS